MKANNNIFLIVISMFLLAGCTTQTVVDNNNEEYTDNQPPDETDDSNTMSFFITSIGTGQGANLGGLEGADAHCKQLAAAVGKGDRTWRAYLSTSGTDGVNARDRIGNGPWYNANGVLIADDIADLHNNATKLIKDTQLNEKGEIVNGRGDTPNRHDILTGSNPDGTLFVAGANDTTCQNWMSSTNGTGSARVGHHDRIGGGQDPTSWNSAHNSRGCSQENLKSSGGDGLFYCFATD
jgi:hypothetical protein